MSFVRLTLDRISNSRALSSRSSSRFAFVALYEGSEITLSGIDRKVFRWFYLYSCLNVLAGGMLAGSFFSQLENIIRTPSSIFTLLGYAVPQSSGFFLAYISTNAFMLEPLRLFLPHGGVLIWFATGCGRRFAWSGRITRDISAYFSPRSQRYGSNYGTQQLIFLICLVFSTASPVITPLGFAYFLLAWLDRKDGSTLGRFTARAGTRGELPRCSSGALG